MKFLVMEVQTFPDGATSTPTYSYETEDAANAKYHSILSAAYASSLPRHGVFLLTDDGMYVKSEFHFNVEEASNEG